MSTSVQLLPILEIPQECLRGVGVLAVVREAKQIALPLADIKIAARVADRVSSVTMTQTFQNPYPEHLEATYIFPLPGGAAISDFKMRVGARFIQGRVEERGEARRQYQQAIDDGKRAALLEKERDDVFTVQVGNIPPGETIGIEISYSERLPFFDDGTTEMRLPLVVAPRYIPGQPLGREQVGEGVEFDTNIVPDASRITPPRLAKGFDPNVNVNIEVELLYDADDDSEIRDLCCSQHATKLSSGRNGLKIALARNDERLNRDFVLQWTVTGERLRTSLVTYKDAGSTYGMLSIIPPQRDKVAIPARDVVFVLDRSGSMEGIKMASAARACALLLATLGPKDRFSILAFDDCAEWLTPNQSKFPYDYFLAADDAGTAQGEKYLRSVESRGGTEMDMAVREALAVINARTETKGRVPVIVFITDGEVGDESRILAQAQKKLGDARLFTIGIDTAVNQGFLQRLANLGKGTATFVVPGTQLEEALRNVGREIGSPLIVDMTIQDIDSGLELETIAPSKVTDLFAGRATTAFFRAQRPGKVRVRGRFTTGGAFEAIVTPKELPVAAIAQLWAKTRISDLEDQFRIEPQSQTAIKQQIIDLSIRHSLLTRFTAFVVVDHSEIVNKQGTHRQMVQPVEQPALWDMDTSAAAMPMEAFAEMECEQADDISVDRPITLTNVPVAKMVSPAPASMPRQRVFTGSMPAVPMERAEPMPVSESLASMDFMEYQPAKSVGGAAPMSPPPPPSLSMPAPSAPSGPMPAKPKSVAKKSAPPSAAKHEEVEEIMEKEAGVDSGLLSKVVDSVKGLFRRSTTAEDAKVQAEATDDLATIDSCITEFAQVLKLVNQGGQPGVEHLEEVWRKAMEAFSRLQAQGVNLPQVANLFYIIAGELFIALRAGNYQAVFAAHRLNIEQAQAEWQRYRQGSPGADNSFWTSTI